MSQNNDSPAALAPTFRKPAPAGECSAVLAGKAVPDPCGRLHRRFIPAAQWTAIVADMDQFISLPRALGAYLAAVSSAALVFILPRFAPTTLVLAWIMAFVAALLPYAAGIAYANWRGIRSWRYFLGGGAATAMLYAPLLAALHRPVQFLGLLPWLALAGVAAGAAARATLAPCRHVLKSPHNEDTDPAFRRPAGGRTGDRPAASMARRAPQ